MPCNANMIVKIKVVVESVKENLVVVWAIGLYSVGTEDFDLKEKDHDTQVTFQKDEYFSVNGKIMTVSTSTHLKILDKVLISNRCSLKVSLVGIVQETSDFKDKENSVIKVSVTDYSHQEYNFVVNVIFQYLDFCFKGLASFIHPKETLVFVIGQIEFIENDIYIYAQDINHHAKKELNNFLKEQLTDKKMNIVDDSIDESLEKLEIDNEQIEVEQDNKVV
ncbi:7138_t:CDS:2, partial [Cetraspora pellucida]